MYIQLIGLRKCRILITVLTLRNRPSKGGTSERCYRTRGGRTYKNERPISWNYEYIIFGQIIFQNFHQFKAFVGLSDCRTIGPSDYRTVGLSDCRIIGRTPPQGTVLGSIMFLCHINDLPDCVNSSVRLFADDCLLYRTIKKEEDHLTLQAGLKHLIVDVDAPFQVVWDLES
jgi:hypothetical protein